MSNRIALLLVGTLLLGTSQASAQSDLRDSTRAILFTGGGFGGSFHLHTETSVPLAGTITNDSDSDLDPTPLVGLRGDVPILEYLAVGGQFGASFWRLDGGNQRNTLLDFDVVPRGRIPFTVGKLLLEPYVAVPIGFTLNVWNQDNKVTSNQNRTNAGWNVGVLGGFSILTRSHFGAMVELGWMHHSAYDSYDNVNLRGSLDQFTMHFGVMYAL